MNFPENFDWVSARAKCSPVEAFTHLESQVEEDINKRTALMSDSEKKYRIRFHFQREQNQFSVWVVRDEERIGYAVFKSIQDGISVSYWGAPDLIGILTLSDDGECRLKVKDVGELSFWQFRKRALEPLLFTLTKDLRQ
jgi:hypothetical protein